jgi:hypothetical protein
MITAETRLAASPGARSKASSLGLLTLGMASIVPNSIVPNSIVSNSIVHKSNIYKSLPKLIRKTGLRTSFFWKGTEACNG